MKSMLHLTFVVVLTMFSAAPSFAGMILLSESRSVTVSYYGGGVETITSDGTFGDFEARAVGIPFGGGSVSAYQKSTITPTGFSIHHNVADFFGPGGFAQSSFSVDFQLLEPTRITIDGYCTFFSGFASLTSGSYAFPLVWGPDQFYRNSLDFDQVLGPGRYTFATNEYLREVVSTRIELRASPVPDDGSSAWMLALAAALCTWRGRTALRIGALRRREGRAGTR